MPLSAYVLMYQYFDNLESELNNRLQVLKNDYFGNNPLRWNSDDLKEIYEIQIKLDFLRKISNNILKVLLGNSDNFF